MKETQRTSSDALSTTSWLCGEETAVPEWLDEMGHVNIQFYFGMAARAVYAMMDRVLRPGAEPADPNPLFFTLEARMLYQAELRVGDRVKVWMRPVERTDKVLRTVITVERAEPKPGISAVCEWTGAYIDPETRRVAKLSDEATSAFDAKIENSGAISPYASPSYPPPRELPEKLPASQVVSATGTIQPDYIDRMGHMGIEHYTRVLNYGNRGYFDGIGFTLGLQEELGWRTFGVTTHVKYLAEMNQGDAYEIRTQCVSIGRKTLTIRHALMRMEGPEPVQSAWAEHTMVTVDFARRRAIELPARLLAKLGELHGVDLVQG